MKSAIQRTISIAPMMGWTNRHCRYFLRQISRHAMLFSEMLAPEAIVLGKRKHHTDFHRAEHPVAFQLGGSDPKMLAEAARRLEEMGYDEINFNVGCPSATGQHRPYGAHLIKQPQLVAECMSAMREAVSIPVSVKTRIGVDRNDDYEPLAEFIEVVKTSGCTLYTIHARKAWLDGLSTRQNREIPPLRYEFVYRLKREFPELTILLNGAITDWSAAEEHLKQVDGLMIGRRAYKDPYWLASVDQQFYQSAEPPPSRAEVLRRCIPYVEAELSQGTALREITRHMIGLFRNVPDASQFRQQLSLETYRRGADLKTYLKMVEIAETIPPLTP